MLNKHVKDQLSLYIDNALSQAERIIIEQHMRECAECREELALLKQTTNMVSQLSAPSLDPDFDQQVKAKIFDWEMKKEATTMKPRWQILPVPATAIAGVLVLLLIAGSLQVYVRRGIQGRIRDSSDQIGDHFSFVKAPKKNLDWGSSDKPASVFETGEYEPVYSSSSYETQSVGGDELTATEGSTFSRTYAAGYGGQQTRRGASRIAGVDSKLRHIDRAKRAEVGSKDDYDYQGILTESEINVSTSPIIVVDPVLPAVGEGERVIRTADITLEVDNGQETYTQLSQLCEEMGGFLAQSQFYKDRDGIQSGVVTLRIPKDKFNEALDKVRKIGKVERINTHSQNVNREYADLQSRLKTAMIVYNKMMKAIEGRKVTIPEAMRLESELTPVTNRIEAIKADIEKLNNLTSFTTITVSFHESKVSPAVIKEGVRRAKENIVLYLLGALHFLVGALPTLLAVLAVIAIGLAVLLYVKHKILQYLNRKK